MVAVFVSALLALSAPSDSVPFTASQAATDAPIRLWINNSRQFREGDQARVQVETRDDGYLVVFNYDTDNHLRVLFPVSPGDDNRVQGGRRYEIRGRADRETFIVSGAGDGIVYAAVSQDPFRMDEFEAGGNWDLSRVSIGDDSKDPEADINELLQRISSDRGFDYDVLTYRVTGYRDYVAVSSGYHPTLYASLDNYYCDPFYGWGCPYSPRGWSVGLGFGYPYSYGGYYPYGYGYGYGYGGGFPIVRHRGNYPIVSGRPRGYTITHRNPSTGSLGGGFGRSAVRSGGARPARPVSWDRPSAGGLGRDGSAIRPPARRSRFEGDNRAGGTVDRQRGFVPDRARRTRESGADRAPSVTREQPSRGSDEGRRAAPRAEQPRRESPRSEGGGREGRARGGRPR